MPEHTSDENQLQIPPSEETITTSVRSEDPYQEHGTRLDPVAPAVPVTPAIPAAASAVPAPPAAEVPSRTAHRGPRTRTMVFSLILLVIAVSVLIAQLTGIHLDAGAVALTVMVIAGVLLIAGGRRGSA